MSAIISDCGLYRYRLERDLGRHGPVAAIFGVNPSTADATVNDATIRKDMGFGHRLGWGRIIKGNLFAFRSTDVKRLADVDDPIGPLNRSHTEQILLDADVVVAAWGPLAKLPKRLRRQWVTFVMIARRLEKDIHCLGVAKDGHPRHTLMLAYETPLVRWTIP